MRSLFILALIVGAGAWYWKKDKTGPASRAAEQKKGGGLVVWHGEKPGGKTWAKLGPTGSITVVERDGLEGMGASLTIRMDGEGFRNCGLNWKGWHPADACDDASECRSLTFWVRKSYGPEGADLTVCLVDNVKRDGGDASNAVGVLAENAVPRLDAEWRKVVLPLEKFTKNKPLKLDRLWGINFGNYGNRPATFHIDRIAFTNDAPAGPRFPKGPPYSATVRLKAKEPTHTIRDEIYGVCSLPQAKLSEYSIPITRWGGNTSTRYNWKINADNGAFDWYFKNRGKEIDNPSENGWVKHIRDNQAVRATTYQTVPIIGWVAKDNKSYGFSVKKYGPQKATEPGHDDIGNGLKPNGDPITGNDPTDTSIQVTPAFIAEGVRLVVQHAGRAEAGGTKYWVLDNEPMIWHATHRDIRQKPLGYDELWQRTIEYAEAIKREDPSAKVAGFCSWGWTDLFYSAKDEGIDKFASRPDYRNHGEVPLAEWFIKKCAAYKKEKGQALIDVFDFHWYPQAQARGKGPYLGKGMDLDLNELRLRSTRDLWDPKYTQESWIRFAGDGKPTAVIRRLREWIDKHNPGMELCLGEYNFGGSDNITGALAQADTFGILAREKVDLAFVWTAPEGSQDLAWPLFRNYDGKGGRFGDRYLPTESEHQDVSIYAAKRSRDGATTIAIINKSLMSPCELRLDLLGLKGRMRVWRVDQDEERVVEVFKEPLAVDGSIKITLPPASANMVVVE